MDRDQGRGRCGSAAADGAHAAIGYHERAHVSLQQSAGTLHGGADLRAAAVREGVEAARHRKQQKEELCEMKKDINEINKQMAEMKLRLKSLQKQEQKDMLAGAPSFFWHPFVEKTVCFSNMRNP